MTGVKEIQITVNVSMSDPEQTLTLNVEVRWIKKKERGEKKIFENTDEKTPPHHRRVVPCLLYGSC